MSPVLKSILDNIEPAVDAAIGEVEAKVQPLTEEGLNVLNNVVAARLDIPAPLISLVSGAETKFTAPLDTKMIAELQLLKLRVASFS